MANAAEHIETNIPRAAPSDSAAEVRRRLAAQCHASVEAIYLVDESGRLTGVVALSALLPAADSVQVGALPAIMPVVVAPEDDEERVATVAFESGLTDVPVVDPAGRLLGIVPARVVIGILRHEHVEDIRRMAGVLAQDRRSRRALEEQPWHRLQHRLPWLLVGLAGSAVATYIMSRYELLMNEVVAVAFFVPALVYLADAIGTQTEAASVRFLSFGQPQLGRLVVGEVVTGLLIGLSLGAAAFPVIALLFDNVRLAIAVCVSLAAAGTIASTTGIVLPWLLWRAGQDPALGSGPLGTIIQDVLSLLIYFSVVSVVMN
jgi:magnesium transporter